MLLKAKAVIRRHVKTRGGEAGKGRNGFRAADEEGIGRLHGLTLGSASLSGAVLRSAGFQPALDAARMAALPVLRARK
jgi:hypothetical protein